MTQFAMVFPGQGSQNIGMLSALSQEYAIIKRTFDEASSVLQYDLWSLTQEGPIEELNKTWKTQPALLAASVSIWRLWQELGYQQPTVMAGHSLGEYSALVCADVIDFCDAIRLVELRGKLMQDAVPAGVGSMAAIIGLDNQAIVDACQQVADIGVAAAVNFNSPGQVVIAGEKEAIEKAGELCKQVGAKRVMPLSVSVPSHCQLMLPAAEKLEHFLRDITFNEPKFKIINNVDVTIETSTEAIRQALVKQLYSPVRWTEIVEKMSQDGIHLLLEIGPGKVLSGLTKRIVSTSVGLSVNDPTGLEQAIASIQ